MRRDVRSLDRRQENWRRISDGRRAPRLEKGVLGFQCEALCVTRQGRALANINWEMQRRPRSEISSCPLTTRSGHDASTGEVQKVHTRVRLTPLSALATVLQDRTILRIGETVAPQ